MNLYFVRHGSAGAPKPHPQEDAKRELDKEGRLQCQLIGELLAALDIRFDEIVASPFRRASEAAAIIAQRTGYRGHIELAPALRPDGTYERFLQLLSEMRSADSALLVGHNSKLAEFIGKLISNSSGRAGIHLKKGAVAKVVKRRTGATLQWCLTPKLLRACWAEQHDAPPRARGPR
ncbi:MAG: phosphohistidine phosphatase SixA [Acidobacteriia bacterium]|nr:phosphohistidine phosphatase SixA [Terriglobia bacterium]